MAINTGDLGYVVAFGGGLVSFLSPCVLPIVPAYLSVLTGLDLAEIQSEGQRHLGRIARDTSLFILGFSAVFIALGLSATAVGRAVFTNQLLLTRLSGLLVLAMGLFLAGSLVLRAPSLYGERRLPLNPTRFGPLAAPVAGAAFGFGWTPCVGPVLGSVLAIAATQGQVARGAGLMAAYSAGLGVPFLATGLALGRLAGAFSWVRRHFVALTLVSAFALAGFGVLLTLNRFSWVTSQLVAVLHLIGLGNLVNLG